MRPLQSAPFCPISETLNFRKYGIAPPGELHKETLAKLPFFKGPYSLLQTLKKQKLIGIYLRDFVLYRSGIEQIFFLNVKHNKNIDQNIKARSSLARTQIYISRKVDICCDLCENIYIR